MYRVETKGKEEARKTYVTWETDPESLASCCSVATKGVQPEDSSQFSTDVGEDRALTVESASSSTEVPTSRGRLTLRSFLNSDLRHLDNVHPAYALGCHVDYYSSTNRCWLQGVVTLGALEDGLGRIVEVVYGVNLMRTYQLRNHVPLHHLRNALNDHSVVEVCTDDRSTWKLARIAKVVHGATSRLYLVEVGTKEVLVPGSSLRRFFLTKSEVFVYRGHSLGFQRGVVQGVVQGTSWTQSGSADEASFVISRAMTPLDGVAQVDFGLVVDPRVFHVDVAGNVESVPVHLLFSVDDLSR